MSAVPTRSRLKCGAAFAATACVLALALVLTMLAAIVIAERPQAFASAHEALARDAMPSAAVRAPMSPSAADNSTGDLSVGGARTDQPPASERRGGPTADTVCLPFEASPQRAVPAGELGDYPPLPVAIVAPPALA